MVNYLPLLVCRGLDNPRSFDDLGCALDSTTPSIGINRILWCTLYLQLPTAMSLIDLYFHFVREDFTAKHIGGGSHFR